MGLKISRRNFNLAFTTAFSHTLGLPSIASTKPKVIIVGGGAGGATVATELKRLSPTFEIILIEPQREYTSCFFSNTFIGGMFPIKYLTHDYKGLEAQGIKVYRDLATAIDLDKKSVHLKNNSSVFYDRLVLSPGIDFIWSSIEGYNEISSEIMPHGWRGRNQLVLLRHQIQAIQNGGTVVIAVPKLPYRCPPGPYERACQIANFFSQNKIKSKVIIFDANFTITKQKAFIEIFETKFKNYIEYHLSNDIDDYTVEKVDIKTNTIFTKSGQSISSSVVNIIPPQRAGSIAIKSGLAEKNWCPVHPENFMSKISESVYIIGDSSKAEEMPKSAYSAYSQGLSVAADISAELEGRPKTKTKYRNICWSIVSQDDAIKIGADYLPQTSNSRKIGLEPTNSFVSLPGESAEIRKATYEEAIAWYQSLTSTIFSKASQNNIPK